MPTNETQITPLAAGRSRGRRWASPLVLVTFIYALVQASPAKGQDVRRWEVGAQFIRLDLDTIGESAGGAGVRVSYSVNPRLALEAEASRFFQDGGGNFGHTEVLAGARYNCWIGPLGLFVRGSPGLLHLGGGTAARNPGREDQFVLYAGAGILVGRGRAGMRIDGGDAIAFWGSQPFAGLARPPTQHNRQLSVGFVIRF